MNRNKKSRDSFILDQESIKLLDTLNIGFIYMDQDFGIYEVNQKIIEWYGGTREDLIGHNTKEFLTPEDYGTLTEIDKAFLSKGDKHYQFEFSFPDRHGERIPFLISISINTDPEGNPVSTNALLTNISDQKRMQRDLVNTNTELASIREALENEKNIIETILFSIGDCVTVFDPDGSILLSNPIGKEIRQGRTNPLLDLKPGSNNILYLEIDGERRQFNGRIEVIYDTQGEVRAYVEILKEITHQLKLEKQESELLNLKRQIKREKIESEMLGISPSMQKVFDLILRCAEVDSSVLILGETGVGKELAARAIHSHSKRNGNPFVAVNCGSIPEALLESELFGYEKGAFTGAVSSRIGLFREADGGTLFLDEVGDLNVLLQVKILRALQEKEVRPIGGTRTSPINVRIVSATNRDLKDLIRRNLFREDLFYRLAVIPLNIPPLRDRPEDILYLAEHFIAKQCGHNDMPQKQLDVDTRSLLLSHQWPGNIRELENAIEYAVTMSRGSSLKPDDFPLQTSVAHNIMNNAGIKNSEETQVIHRTTSFSNQSTLQLKPWEEEERRHIAEILEKCRDNKSDAAAMLNMSRSTLWRKMKIYHLT